MPTQPAGPPDPYEYGLEVAQRKRVPLPELPADPRRRGRGRRKWFLALFVVLTAILITRGVQSEQTGSLTADCGRVQVKVAEQSVASHGRKLLHWSVTAGHGVRYVVAINASTVTLSGDVATAVPAAGSAGQASRVQTIGHECLGRGAFGVLLPPGTYPVTLFQISADGTATAVASTRLRVTP